MKFSIGRVIKVISLLCLIIIVGIVAYYELCFLEYYRLPTVSFVEVKADHTKLINGIESYQRIEQFSGHLSRTSLRWRVEPDSQSSPKGRPPFNITNVVVGNYSNLDIQGKLKVLFFNNRLTSTRFYPSDFEKYIKALQKEGIKFNNNQEVEIPPYTAVRFGSDHTGHQYVDWSDIRLDNEIKLWIKRYS